jgi:hypothetical protein
MVIYYGSNPFYTCEECIKVWHAKGPKWRLIYQLLTSETAWNLVSVAFWQAAQVVYACMAMGT